MSTPFGQKIFPTVEHYFQYKKAPNDRYYLEKILQGDAHNARSLGQYKKWQPFDLADQAMDEAVDAKLKQHSIC